MFSIKGKTFSGKTLKHLANALDLLIVIAAALFFILSLTGAPFLNSPIGPNLSPFTLFSLFLMAGSRMAARLLSTWSKPMTLALLGMVACGNLSSLWMQLTVPDIFISSIQDFVPTSAMTSVGIIFFCLYEILVEIRKTPDSALIVDDILLHLALFPGGMSLLGHSLGVLAYTGSSLDPRIGIGLIEMAFMATYALVAIFANRNLFLWKFLKQSVLSQLAFAFLFINQYVAPIIVGKVFRPPTLNPMQFGIEFYVMLAGVFATLLFLLINAYQLRRPHTP